jgi:hypothetical protein
MTPREIIAKALGSVIGWARTADLILAALNSAGYRILGPGEWDKETVEKCAEVAETRSPDDDSLDWQARKHAATAIRALAKEKQG